MNCFSNKFLIFFFQYLADVKSIVSQFYCFQWDLKKNRQTSTNFIRSSIGFSIALKYFFLHFWRIMILNAKRDIYICTVSNCWHSNRLNAHIFALWKLFHYATHTYTHTHAFIHVRLPKNARIFKFQLSQHASSSLLILIIFMARTKPKFLIPS